MKFIGKLLLAGVGLLVFLSIVLSIADPQSSNGGGGGHAARIETRDLRSSERSTIADAVRAHLKDPQSAQFMIGRVAYSALPERGSRAYCGRVRAKNSFGGYGGEEMFMVLLNVQDERVRGAAFAGLGTTSDGSSIEQLCGVMGYDEVYLRTTTFQDAR